MGLDGGTTVTRADVLRGASWRLATADTSRSTRGGSVSTSALIPEEAVNRAAAREAQLSCCFLTGDDLQPPLCADYLGHIYNKSAVLEFLMARSHASFKDDAALHRHTNILRTHGTRLDHLRRLRDVFDIHLPANSASGSAAARPTCDASLKGASPSPDGAGSSVRLVEATCPITQMPFATTPFAVLAKCGHCLSRRAIMMARGGADSTGRCSVCDAAFDADVDVVDLAPLPEAAEKLRDALRKRKGPKLLKAAGSKKRLLEGKVEES